MEANKAKAPVKASVDSAKIETIGSRTLLSKLRPAFERSAKDAASLS